MELTGVILAGGKSSRMGEDKGLLNFNGKRLVEYSIELLKPICSEILISTNQTGYEQFGFSIVVDNYLDCGPIGGLEASLLRAKNKWCIVVSCDTPFLERYFLMKMVSEIKLQDCIIPMHNNGIEPLAGIYSKKLATFFRDKIGLKDFKLRRIIKEINVDFFDANLILEKYPRLFLNLNSIEDVNSI